MTNEELSERNRNRRIFQIGFVTRDVEKSMRAWLDNLGDRPVDRADFHRGDDEESEGRRQTGNRAVQVP